MYLFIKKLIKTLNSVFFKFLYTKICESVTIDNFNQVDGRSALKNSKTCPRRGTQGKPSYTVPFRICVIEISMASTSTGNIRKEETTRRTTFFC